jgi:MinD-like ATPase involved in chromosome partitioning or flagellar assembly
MTRKEESILNKIQRERERKKEKEMTEENIEGYEKMIPSLEDDHKSSSSTRIFDLYNITSSYTRDTQSIHQEFLEFNKKKKILFPERLLEYLTSGICFHSSSLKSR